MRLQVRWHDGYFEKGWAIAIEERCKVIMLLEKLKDVANNPDWQTRGLSHDHDWYMAEATRELAAEAGNWRKIGPAENEAIQRGMVALQVIEEDFEEEDIKDQEAYLVLRKLLEGL